MFDSHLEMIDGILHIPKNFDVVKKQILIAGRIRACLYYVNPFGNSDIMNRIISFLLVCDEGAKWIGKDTKRFLESSVPITEFTVVNDLKDAIHLVLSGATLMIMEDVNEYCILDIRKYLQRGVDEPQKDKVLRGSHDGFVEALLPNIGLIRRRIRDKNLIFEKITVGSRSGTDIAVGYIEGLAEDKEVTNILNRLENLQVEALPMGQESLIEVLVNKRWYNPFPKVRYTERPDSAAATLLEGGIILLCDNNPSAMILPTCIFDFLQDTDDFSFPPMVGGYLKFVRIGVYFMALLITPIWYLLLKNSSYVPESLAFFIQRGESTVPILLQLLLVELGVDGLKLASLNTPDALNSSLGIIGGLILGEMAIKVGWLSAQVIFYMAFAAIANFTQPSYELGYAFKFMRMLTLILIALFNVWGLILGFVITILLIATNKGPGLRSYLYPLIPFNRIALRRLLFRSRLRPGQIQPVSRQYDKTRH